MGPSATQLSDYKDRQYLNTLIAIWVNQINANRAGYLLLWYKITL